VRTGSFDVYVAALFYSNDHMYELITKRLNHVKGVLRTSTSTVGLAGPHQQARVPSCHGCRESETARRDKERG
jgi:hypothetical protein